jgi:NAD+ diphosphatase
VLSVSRLSPLPLARSTLDRATERRVNPAWVDARWSDPRCRVLVMLDGKAPVNASGTALVYTSPSRLGELGLAEAEHYLLGLDGDGVPYFVVPGDVPGDPSTGGVAGPDAATVLAAVGAEGLVSVRDAGHLLSDRDAGVFVHATALVNWHANHPRCSRCGAVTTTSHGGHVRECPACRAQHFPRTDPAIIVLVTDSEDRCLLGRQRSWPAKRFSTLAGFVEPGEPLEHAVAREVREETGVEIVNPVYAGSQPWPFPSSLMLGFFATAVTTQIKVDEEEIAEARWFSRDQLAEAVRTAELLLPGHASIARRLIESWYGDELIDH